MKKLIALFIWLSFTSSVWGNPIHIVTSFSILEDLVRQVVGEQADHIIIHNIVKINSDPHIYQPSPNDVALLSKADLIIVNGLGLEGWIDRLIKASHYKGRHVIVSDKIRPRILTSKDGTLEADPHAWHSVNNVILYVEAIITALCEIDSSHADYYKKRGKLFIDDLKKLDCWVQQQFKKIPKSKRVVVTTHDAFGYFGIDYRIRFLSPLGLSTETEPAAFEVATLINQIRQEKIKGVFIENLSNRKLIDQIAEEAGVQIKGKLYADSLSEPTGPAPTYIKMIEYNTLTLSTVLKD